MLMMTTELTTKQWVEILQDDELTNELDLSIFRTFYSFPEHKAPASRVGLRLGYENKSPQGPVNLEIGRYAKRIAENYDIEFSKRTNQKYKFWDLFSDGWSEGRRFIWQLKPHLVEALERTNLVGEFPIAEELPPVETDELHEGAKRSVTVNSFERNANARKRCIEHWGCSCSVCNVNFEDVYGEIGKGYIHVHHLTPLSEIGKSYEIDPIEDLRPVCPNCHAMIHIKNPPFSIEQLKVISNQ